PTLGGVCLNVGCIPSKALLHTAAVMYEVREMAAHGISYSPPQIDLDKLRSHKERVVGRLTGGLAGMAKARKVTVLRRNHRAGNGNGLLNAWHAHRCGGDARWPNDGCRSRSRESMGEEERQPLRQGDAQDKDSCRRGDVGWD